MNENIKIAVIGCGYWGKNLVRNFSEIGNLAAIFDSCEKTAVQIADKYKVEFKSWESILADDSIDGVVIATPAPMHYELASKVLAAGKSVFIEKPLALNTSDAKKLIDKARNENKTLMVGHLLQYHSAFIKVKELVALGAVGDLYRIYSNRLSFGKVRTEENVLWSFAPHDISMILSLIGEEPIRIDASGSSHLSDLIEDYVQVQLEFNNHISAHIFVSWLNPFKEQKLVIVGDKAILVFDDMQAPDKKIALYKSQVKIKDGIPQHFKADAEYIEFEIKEPLKEECMSFINSIEKCVKPYTDGNEGLKVLKVLESAQACIDSKKNIRR